MNVIQIEKVETSREEPAHSQRGLAQGAEPGCMGPCPLMADLEVETVAGKEAAESKG